MSYSNDRKTKKCLILVPHQDDETILAGNTISALSSAGIETFVLYSTNGDWKYKADVRIREAYNALNCLGRFDKEHIILLGYGDNYNDPRNHTHYYYSINEKCRSTSGKEYTYGAFGIEDFAGQKHGHSPYCREAFISDLRDAIETVRADIIICVDFDEHPDHRMLTLSFDEVMGRILRSRTDYTPLVLKGFAYSTAYTAVRDLYENPLKRTVRPQVGKTGKYEFDMIDSGLYEWDKRICITASANETNRSFFINRKAKALRKHKTQHVILYADRIINRDEVFWLRRTDSLSYRAKVTASDGMPEYLNDFRLYNVSEIDSKAPQFEEYIWKPANGSSEAVFEWKEPCNISYIRVYGNIDTDSEIQKVSISFDTGYSITAGPLPARGRCLEIEIEPQRNVRKCTLAIPEQRGANCGIAEIEFYENKEVKGSEIIDALSGNHATEAKESFLWAKRATNDMLIFAEKVSRKTRKLMKRVIKQ